MGAKNDAEIDLTPYGAMDRGVSRHHALLHLADDHLYLTDLQSTNGTYVAGQRLEPDTPTVVHKGDEVLLGRLSYRYCIRFLLPNYCYNEPHFTPIKEIRCQHPTKNISRKS
jgi:hypothetical protein